MVSMTQAWAIDLMGQVCSGQLDGVWYGGVDAKPDFVRGAAESEGGKSIICLSSTYQTEDGERRSAIVPLLRQGEGVTLSRDDVHYVATEWGIENLYAKSVQERALLLIQIAHPDYRDWLLAEAKELDYIREGFVLKSRAAYPEEEERHEELNSGESILIRPAKASDFRGLQDFLYHTDQKEVASRFHGPVSSLPESKYGKFVNVDYENNMAFVAIAGENEDERIVANADYSYDDDSGLAEFSTLVHQDWQRKGLAGKLRQRMIEYARSKNAKGYFDTYEKENPGMKKLAEKSENVTTTYVGGKIRAVTLF